jgi:acetylornithine/succinyldiaminopimelate/putrescine aminotransferase
LGSTVFSLVNKKEFLDGVVEKGEYLKEKLAEIQKNRGEITGIFGRGLLIGVQFNIDIDCKKVMQKAREKSLLLVRAEKNMIRFLPPLIISKEELDEALEIFVSVLDELKV